MTADNCIDISIRLGDLRREKGLSQEELAEKLGLSRQAVSKWERGESQPDMGNLVALADVYEVTIDEIVRFRPDDASDAADTSDTSGASGTSDASDAPNVASDIPDIASDAKAEEASPAADISTMNDASRDDGKMSEETHEVSSFPPPPTGQPVDPAASTIPPFNAPPTPPRKKVSPWLSFPYPLLVVLIFLIAGFAFGLWHPAWILFLTIPFYYWIVAVITNDPLYKESHEPQK